MAGWPALARSLGSGHLLDLPRTHAQSLARLARLTEHEVMAMTLAPMRETFPPITTSLASPDRRLRTDSWVTVGETRYCPSCLAGDGSEIQNRYGGPWKVQWHLPVLFACPQHRQFLRHTCPACGQPSDPLLTAARPTTADTLLAFRPTQCCRTVSLNGPPCGHHLEQDGDPLPPPAPALVDLQTRLQALLRSTDAQHAQQSFADLRMLVPLLYFSWPRSKRFLRAELHDAAAAFLETCWWWTPSVQYATVRYDAIDLLPQDAQACAAFVDAADRLLKSEDLSGHLAELRAAAFDDTSDSTNWARAYRKRRALLSPRLRSAADPVIHPPPRRPASRRRREREPLTGIGSVSYALHHIPASLRDEWVTDEFRRLTAPRISLRLLRRTAAAMLVQRSASCSLLEAAHWLGIRPRAIEITAADDLPRWQHGHPQRARALTAAVDQLVRRVDADEERIDYRTRREELRDWSIPVASWEMIISQLPPCRGAPDLGGPQARDRLGLRLDDCHSR